MIYKVFARFDTSTATSFFSALTDGRILQQQPDGREIVDSMKRAVITLPDRVEWYETCYCPTPLQHERATVYDHYFSEITTELAHEKRKLDGHSFWEYLQQKAFGS